MTTKSDLVTFLRRKMLVFGVEACSRHRFWSKTSQFWRRASFSSPFLGGNYSILTTRPFLVAIFGWELLNFDDETLSRHRFEVKNTRFWRRDPFSSLFLGGKYSILTTRVNLVTILR
ncbi:hypothetical protein P5F75_09940 [Caldifermentibacillus hisashii]|uniref:hypothetical protein n=1 Tax=Caldifermentibacillus hisashii TaxID=996558 RepID=UPI002E1D4D87|nr:hypothetical protein [Caldifermentibacillus hisashii]